MGVVSNQGSRKEPIVREVVKTVTGKWLWGVEKARSFRWWFLRSVASPLHACYWPGGTGVCDYPERGYGDRAGAGQDKPGQPGTGQETY